MYVYLCVCVCVCAGMKICIYLCMYVCMQVCMYVCRYVCVCVCVCVCMYVYYLNLVVINSHMYIYLHSMIYIYVCIYTALGQALNAWKANLKELNRLRSILMKVSFRWIHRVRILCQQLVKHISS